MSYEKGSPERRHILSVLDTYPGLWVKLSKLAETEVNAAVTEEALRLQASYGRNIRERVIAFLALPENVNKKFDCCQIRHKMPGKKYALSTLVQTMSSVAHVQGNPSDGYFIAHPIAPEARYLSWAKLNVQKKFAQPK